MQFRDCPHCSKRIRIDAVRCHRCDQPVSSNGILSDEEPTEHAAVGGYALEDGFDYDEYLQEEFGGRLPRRKMFWAYITWIMIIVMLVTSLSIGLVFR